MANAISQLKNRVGVQRNDVKSSQLLTSVKDAGSEFLVSYLEENSGVVELKDSAGANEETMVIANLSETDSSENFVWSHQTTMMLLDEYKRRADKFRDPKVKKRDLWTEIKLAFQKNGHCISEDLLDRKFRNLKKTFTTILEKRSKMPAGRNSVRWEYFDIFNEIFKDDKFINFATVTSLPAPLPEPPSEVFNSSRKISEKSHKWKYLDMQRKAHLDLDRERVQALRRLVAAVEKNNVIQIQRNNMLKALLAARKQ